jgi:hypothetical protein
LKLNHFYRNVKEIKKPNMSEGSYRLIAWGCLLIAVALAFGWCITETGPAGWMMDSSERFLDTRLVQVSWLITFLIVALPGYMLKRYFDGLAWSAHLKSLPPPDLRESAKRSKYVKLEAAPPPLQPAAPVNVSELPKGQEEFIATCPGCGSFFPATKSAEAVKCPNCGEALPIA